MLLAELMHTLPISIPSLFRFLLPPIHIKQFSKITTIVVILLNGAVKLEYAPPMRLVINGVRHDKPDIFPDV